MADTTEPMAATGYVLCEDMIFMSRITGTAQALGLTMKPARSMDVLRNLVAQQWPTCIVIDLANPSLNLVELIKFLKGGGATMPRLVAYGSHVDTAALKAAREAGCDLVLPRSRFVEELPRALPDWMGFQPGATS